MGELSFSDRVADRLVSAGSIEQEGFADGEKWRWSETFDRETK